METSVRTAACPRGCGGTLTIHERTVERPGDGPVAWEYVGVRCSMGCQLREGEVPRRG